MSLPTFAPQLPIRRVFRCTKCFLSPLPKDVNWYWGSRPEDLAQPMCLRCRGVDISDIAYFPKLLSVPDKFLGRWQIPPQLKHLLAGFSSYLTDGERIWKWMEFPVASSQIKIPLENFLQGRRIVWLTSEIPPGVPRPPAAAATAPVATVAAPLRTFTDARYDI